MAALQRLLRTGSRPMSLESVLYVDRQLLVLNKPPGLISQLGKPSDRNQRLDHMLQKIRKTFELKSELYPLHRLDVGTTGCLAVATTEVAARAFSQQFAQGDVNKTYLALVRGGEQTFTQKSGTIDAPILYDPVQGYFDKLDPTGKRSITEWEVLSSSPIAPLSLVRLKLLTGNKHQLRIHMAMKLGAPILGDARYSRSPLADAIKQRAQIPERVFLHASELAFLRYRQRGGSKRFRLGIRAPLLEDFAKLCETFRIDVPEGSLRGGLSIDDKHVEDVDLPDLNGHWLLGRTPIPAGDIGA